MATSSLESQSPRGDAPSPPPGRGQEAPKPWVGATPDTPRLTLGPGGPTRPAAPGNPVAPWGRRGERWLRCDIPGLPIPQPPAHPPDTHGGTLSTAGSFGTSYTSGTLGRREKRVGKAAGGLRCPQRGRVEAMPQISCPKFGGCTHLGAGCARGTLGTGSAGVTLLPGLSLLAFGTGLSVGALHHGGGKRPP